MYGLTIPVEENSVVPAQSLKYKRQVKQFHNMRALMEALQ